MRWIPVTGRGNQIPADDRLELLKCKCVMTSCGRYTVAEHGLRGECVYVAWRMERTAAHPYGLMLGAYKAFADDPKNLGKFAKDRCELDAMDYAQDRRAG